MERLKNYNRWSKATQRADRGLIVSYFADSYALSSRITFWNVQSHSTRNTKHAAVSAFIVSYTTE